MKSAFRVALACSFFLLGCVTRAPLTLPTLPQPAVEERADILAPAPLSRLSLPLELDIGALLPLVSEALQKELRFAQSDWTRVTAPGANPEVETHMQASIGALRVSVREGAVRLEVPVAYWGKVRAHAKTPFGTVWLSKGTAWGTREAPGRVILEIDVRPSIDRAFKLATRSSLADLRLEAPEGDKLCTTTLVRICIPREQAAARVHAELSREIRKRAPAVLETVDARVAQQGEQLRAYLAQALSALARPSAADQLALQVEELALGTFSGKQTRLRVNTELAFRASLFEPDTQPAKLPARGELRGGPSELTYDVVLPFSEAGQRWARKFAAEPVEGWTLAGCEVLGAEKDGPALVLALSLKRDGQSLRVFAYVLAEQHDSEIRLASVRLGPESSAALAALGMAAPQLAEFVRRHSAISVAEDASVQLARIEQKLGVLTLALTPVTLRLERAEYQALRPVGNALLVRVHMKPGVRLAGP